MEWIYLIVCVVALLAGVLIAQSRSIWSMLVAISAIGVLASSVALIAGTSLQFAVLAGLCTVALLDIGLVMGLCGQNTRLAGSVSHLFRRGGRLR